MWGCLILDGDGVVDDVLSHSVSVVDGLSLHNWHVRDEGGLSVTVGRHYNADIIAIDVVIGGDCSKLVGFCSSDDDWGITLGANYTIRNNRFWSWWSRRSWSSLADTGGGNIEDWCSEIEFACCELLSLLFLDILKSRTIIIINCDIIVDDQRSLVDTHNLDS